MAIGLFIDGAYVYKVYNDYMNYIALRSFIEQELGDTVDEGYFFNADDDPPKAQKLHNALTFPPPGGPGLRVKVYWLQKKQLYWPRDLGGHPVMHPTIPELQYEMKMQKAVDVGLVFHMTRSYHKRRWTKLVLAAGDGDFHEPVQSLVETENVDLYLIGSLQTISEELRPYARKIFEIDKEPLHSKLLLDRVRK
ncbi:MAG: NYN domain-containing protein [Blastocatellia bacterium]